VGAWDGSWLDRGGARVEGGSQLSRGVTRLGREHGSVAHTRRGEGARERGGRLAWSVVGPLGPGDRPLVQHPT
jgi:hypothetical protein